MRGAGAERVIPAMLSLPRMRPAALLSVLFQRIKKIKIKKVYRVYVTDACVS